MYEGRTLEPSKSSIRIHSIGKIQKVLIEWGKRNYDEFPWRSSKNAFHALIAEMMLQRTKAEQVEPIYNTFSSKYKTPSDASSDKLENIVSLLQPLGLNWRIEKIIECIRVLDERDGQIPLNLKELLKLPGIGLYAASSFLSFHAGIRAPIVDSNVVRLYGRTFGFLTDAETRRKKWFLEISEQMTPDTEFREYNYAILDLTRKICKKVPLCHDCPIYKYCNHYQNTIK